MSKQTYWITNGAAIRAAQAAQAARIALGNATDPVLPNAAFPGAKSNGCR